MRSAAKRKVEPTIGAHVQALELFKIATEHGQHKSVGENPFVSLPLSRLIGSNLETSAGAHQSVRLLESFVVASLGIQLLMPKFV